MADVLIVGEGELGKAVGKEFSGFYNVLSINRTKLGRELSEKEFLDAIEQIIKNYSPMILVNCVGHFELTPTDGVYRAKQFERIFVPNVKLAWNISRVYFENMIDVDSWKYLVHIGSESAIIPHTNSALYCASKAALFMLTKNLARDWYTDNFCVFQVDPGVIENTDMGSIKNLGELGNTYRYHSFVTKEIVAKFVRNLVELGPYTAGQSYPIGVVLR